MARLKRQRAATRELLKMGRLKNIAESHGRLLVPRYGNVRKVMLDDSN